MRLIRSSISGSTASNRARLMEYVMATEWDAKMMLEHPVLKAKLQLLCDAIRQSFDTEDWEKLYWERFF